MEKQTRYKMHKVKKQWVAVSVATLAFALAGGKVASADDVVAPVANGDGTANATQEAAQTSDQASITTYAAADATAQDTQVEAVPQGQTPAAQMQTQADGKTYMIDQQSGEAVKNYGTVIDDKTYYFDESTGEAQTELPKTQNISTSTNNQVADSFQTNNQAYTNDASSFEVVDGFVTADSWYRPRKVFKNGETWTVSTEKDLRPVLMTWWPDTATKQAYVDYWVSQGLIQNTRNLDLAVQDIQIGIERKIAQEGNTQWLRDKMSTFVKSQSQWNIDSEDYTTYGNQDHLQGGALLYTNSNATAHANSNYRLLNRNPTFQTGQQKYFKSDYAGYELLLANDIDNSNPIVQAEDLNHFHFLMNWGEIVLGDADANYDGVRVDAVDNVDADLLQIQRDYYKAKYGIDQSEKNAIDHLSILEAWSGNDNDYVHDHGNFSLSIDNDQRSQMLAALTAPASSRSSILSLATAGLKNRASNANSEPLPNYVFIRAHDSEVQTRIARIIRERLGKGNTDGLTNITLDDLEQAFKIYNEDMNASNKMYYTNNLPMAYAWMLQNKDTVTRVYYGDMYTDNGQYMETKTPFYDAIETMLKARIKYVAGGQSVSTTQLLAGDILTSVRFGKGANTATDTGTSETRTSGMALLMNNNPNFRPVSGVTLNMGAAHRNQAYRPLLISTSTGIATYLNDSDVSSSQYKYTDSQGRLKFSGSELRGYANTQVSGMLQVWVPVGAADNQDVRTAPSNSKHASGNIYEQTDALDSQVIYEGFSNFQDFAKTPEQYTNVVISKNADLFKSWGITHFEMAPQYVSSEDGSFLDSIILNGYAFKDRYDLALSQNNKYGSKEDHAAAIKALHAAGIKVLSDWVPDQIYDLPGKEVVTATRVDQYGNTRQNSQINRTPYVVNTRSYGDYQEQYGGEFLDELQKLYPSLFTTRQISTGKPIDPSVKIKNWSAKYMNGTNILGRGAKYVLSDNGRYFNLETGKFYLPSVLNNTYGTPETSGLVNKDGAVYYQNADGSNLTSQFKEINGSWYYFGADGKMAVGEVRINGQDYLFMPNGKQLRDGVWAVNGKSYYYDNAGKRSTQKGFVSFSVGNQTKYRYFNSDHSIAVGLVKIDGRTYYFDANGFQVKGANVTIDGKVYTFDANSGEMTDKPVTGRWVALSGGQWGYRDANGKLLTGLQTIEGYTVYFRTDGSQVKGGTAKDASGVLRFFDRDKGRMVTRTGWYSTSQEQWVYVEANGLVATGLKTIGNQTVYFDANGIQAKGQLVTDNGVIRYFDKYSGNMVRNQELTIGGKKYRFNANGEANEVRTKGFVSDSTGVRYYYDNGSQARNTYIQDPSNGEWYYFNANGLAVTGWQNINNVRQYFFEDGRQAKNEFVTIGGRVYYFDNNWAQMATNQYVQNKQTGKWYYMGANGAAVTGWQRINNVQQYFHADGTQAKDEFVTINGRVYYFDGNWGKMAAFRYVYYNGRYVWVGLNGVVAYA